MYSLHPELAVNRRCCPPPLFTALHAAFCLLCRPQLTPSRLRVLPLLWSILSTLQRRTTSPATSTMTRPRRSFPLSLPLPAEACASCASPRARPSSLTKCCISPSFTHLSLDQTLSQHLHSSLPSFNSIFLSNNLDCWCRAPRHHSYWRSWVDESALSSHPTAHLPLPLSVPHQGEEGTTTQ